MSLTEILSRLLIKGATNHGGSAAYKDQLPILDKNGQLDPSFLSNVLRTNVFLVANAAARLALTAAYDGDICKEEDTHKAYILNDPDNAVNAYSDTTKWIVIGTDISTASQVAFTATGGLTASNVQTAIEALNEKRVSVEVTNTITAVHTFDPVVPGAPFILAADAQGQLVTGLNADLLDGNSSAYFLARANHTGTVAGADIRGTITTDLTGNVTGDLTGGVIVPIDKYITINSTPTDDKHAVTVAYVQGQLAAKPYVTIGSVTPTAETVGATGVVGSATTAASANHKHAMPGLVTAYVDGFAAATDKARFDRCDCGGFDAPVTALLVNDASIYAGGTFTKYGNVPSRGLARLDFSGSYSPDFKFTTSELFPLSAQPSGVDFLAASSIGVWVGAKVTDPAVNRIYSVKNDGTLDTAFNLASSTPTVTGNIVGIAAIDTDRVAFSTPTNLYVATNAGTITQTFAATNKLNTGLASSQNLSAFKKLVLASSAYSSAASVGQAGVVIPAVEQLFDTIAAPAGLKLLDFRTGSKDTAVFIGDYGVAGPVLLAISTAIKAKKPDYIITLGDNNYELGGADTIDTNIGQYFGTFIEGYAGAYGVGPGTDENMFYPVPGNHDAGNIVGAGYSYEPYLDFFPAIKRKLYYSFVRGNAEYFMLNSDQNNPDGLFADGKMGQWLKDALAASKATWKIVAFHHAPYSSERRPSSVVGGNAVAYGDSGSWMRWSFKDWGADIVLAGHAHTYERLEVDGLPYIVNGVGGHSVRTFGTPIEGSKVRSNVHGFGTIEIEADTLTFKQYNQTGIEITAALFKLTKSVVLGKLGQVDLNYSKNAGSGAEASCANPVLSPDGTFIVVGNSLADFSLNYKWNARRGNLLLHSETFATAAWTSILSPVTITSDSADGPFEGTKAVSLTDPTGNNYSYITQDYAPPVTTPPTPPTCFFFSIYVKKDEVQTRFPLFKMETAGAAVRELAVVLNTANGNIRQITNLLDGDVHMSVEGIGEGDRKYWKLTLGVYCLIDTDDQIIITIYPAYTSNFGGTSIVTTGTITVFGAQLRQSEWANAYVKTTDTAVNPSAASATKYRGFYKIGVDGKEYTDWACNISMVDSTQPKALCIDSKGRIYFTGNVAFIDGVTVSATALYRLKANGSLDKVFSDFNNAVHDAKLLSDNTLVVGGAFTAYGVHPVGRIVFLHSDGMLAPSVILSDSTPTAIEVGAVGGAGSSAAASRADHAHPFPGKASQISDGLFSKEDKVKLDAVELQKSVSLCVEQPVTIVPVLTSNTHTTGLVVSASTNDAYAFNLFDGKVLTSTSGWSSGEVKKTGETYPLSFIKVKFPEKKRLLGYALKAAKDKSPYTWSLQGSDDGIKWDILHTTTDPDFSKWEDINQAGINYVSRNYTFENVNSYFYYKLEIPVNAQKPDGPYTVALKAIHLFDAFPAADVKLNGQELCVKVKVKQTGGIIATPTGLAIDPVFVSNNSAKLPLATTIKDGLMSKEDKTRLDLIGGGSFDGVIDTIVVSNQHIYVGGEFSNYHNISTPKLARLDLQGRFDKDFNIGTGFEKEITAIEPDDLGNVYVASVEATHFNNSPTRNQIWKIDTTGAKSSSFTPVRSVAAQGIDSVIGLKYFNTRLLALTPRSLKTFDTNGAELDSKDAGESLHGIEKFGLTALLSSRPSTTFNNELASGGLKKINAADGSLATPFTTNAGAGAAATCGAIAIHPDGSYYVVGNSLTYGALSTHWDGKDGNQYRGLYGINANGTAVTSFNVALVIADAVSTPAPFCISKDDFLYLGGNISSINTISVTPWRLYKLNAKTGVFIMEIKGFNGKVNDCKLAGDKLVVGGAFTAYGKQPCGHLVMLNQDGTIYDPCCSDTQGDQLPNPVITPNTGYVSIAAPINVKIEVSGFSTAAIYYTFTSDGTTPAVPTTASTLYTAPISVNATYAISAISVKSGYTNGKAVAYFWTMSTTKLPKIQFDPPSGSLTPISNLTLTCPNYPSAVIKYTVDGSIPTNSSAVYTSTTKPSLTGTVVVKAYAYSTDTALLSSEISMAYYSATTAINIDFGGAPDIKIGKAAWETGTTSDKWNAVQLLTPTAGKATLRWTTGQTSTAKIAFVCDPISGLLACDLDTIVGITAAPTINDPMMLTAIKNTIDGANRDSSRYEITDTVGGTYDIYVYAHGPTNAESSIVVLWINDSFAATKFTTKGTDYVSTIWAEGIQFIKFSDVKWKSGDKVAISVSGRNELTTGYNAEVWSRSPGYLNGMQLVQTALERLSAPVITPSSEAFPIAVTLTHTSALVGVQIYYTIDGSTPTISSTPYSTVFQVTVDPTTVKAIAYWNGYLTSPVATTVFSKPTLDTVTFAPTAGFSAIPFDLKLSHVTTGVTIKYTINGDTPTDPGSITYTLPITISAPSTVKAYASKDGWKDSAVKGQQYDKATVAPVIFDPFPCDFVSGSVGMTCATAGTTIYYTTDGTAPTRASSQYSAPVSVRADTTLKAFATNTSYSDSRVTTANYAATVLASVVFDPASGTTKMPVTNLRLTVPNRTKVTIYYTLDDTDPRYSQTVRLLAETGLLSLTGTTATTIKAYAVLLGLSDSCVAAAKYDLPKVEDVTFSIPAGNVTFPVTNLELATATAAATICYTVNGQDPQDSRTANTDKIYIHNPPGTVTPLVNSTTVRAYAAKTGVTPSNTTSATYSLANSVDLYWEGRTKEDKVGGWDNFGPGDATPKSGNSTDYKFTFITNFTVEKNVAGMTIFSSDRDGNPISGQHITTFDSQTRGPFVGLKGYPMPVYESGNTEPRYTTYADIFGGIGIGKKSFVTWWQPVRTDIDYFTLLIKFTDGQSVQKTIPATVSSPPMANIAALINIDFYPSVAVAGGTTGESKKTGIAAIGKSGIDYWNGLSKDNAFAKSLLASDRTQAGASIAVTDGEITSGGWTGPTKDTDSVGRIYDAMYNYCVYSNDTFTLSVTNLAIGSYDVYVYGHGSVDIEYGKYSIGSTVTALTEYTTTTSGAGDSNWMFSPLKENTHYVLCKSVKIDRAADKLLINVLVTESNKAVINGIQLKKLE